MRSGEGVGRLFEVRGVGYVKGDGEDFIAGHARDEDTGLFEAIVARSEVPRHEVEVGAFGLGASCHGLPPGTFRARGVPRFLWLSSEGNGSLGAILVFASGEKARNENSW